MFCSLQLAKLDILQNMLLNRISKSKKEVSNDLEDFKASDREINLDLEMNLTGPTHAPQLLGGFMCIVLKCPYRVSKHLPLVALLA